MIGYDRLGRLEMKWEEARQLSPRCQDGRHFQCARWWWVMKDKIALTCFCRCHE